MDNAVVTRFGSQPTPEQAKEAKKSDDFIFEEEPKEVDYNSLEEALTGEWLEREHLRVGLPFL